ncbi:MAG: hypothetical protein MST07_05390, partial [Firmicutes bacterium]|nr:hypothetical protein [Bacillota bacterium]
LNKCKQIVYCIPGNRVTVMSGSRVQIPDSPPVKSTESIGSVLFLSLLAGIRNNQRDKGRTDSIFDSISPFF